MMDDRVQWYHERRIIRMENEGLARGGGDMGGKVLDGRSDADFEVATGHPVRDLCLWESSCPKTGV